MFSTIVSILSFIMLIIGMGYWVHQYWQLLKRVNKLETQMYLLNENSYEEFPEPPYKRRPF